MFVKKGNSIINLNMCKHFYVQRCFIFFEMDGEDERSWEFKDNNCCERHFDKLWKLMCAHNQHPIMYYDFTKEDY